jgi:hypothetical protein
MSAIAVFGNWPPTPHVIGIATVAADGTLETQSGGCIASVVHAGSGQYQVNTVPGRIGGWATGLLSPGNVQVTCNNLIGQRGQEVSITGANQLLISTFDSAGAGALADSAFYIEFSA